METEASDSNNNEPVSCPVGSDVVTRISVPAAAAATAAAAEIRGKAANDHDHDHATTAHQPAAHLAPVELPNPSAAPAWVRSLPQTLTDNRDGNNVSPAADSDSVVVPARPAEDLLSPAGATDAVDNGSSEAKPEHVLIRCTLCGRKCRDVRRHLEFHLGRKPFQCAQCGKRFQVKSNLLLHQRAAHSHVVPSAAHSLTGDPMDAVSNTGLDGSQKTNTLTTSFSYPHDDSSLVNSSQSPDQNVSPEQKKDATPESSAQDGENNANNGSPIEQKSHSDREAAEGHFVSPEYSSGSRSSPGDQNNTQEDDDYQLRYPSAFPGVKHQISIRNETVLVTRLDGTNRKSGDPMSLFKCHMCGKIFNFLSKLQCHLSMHFERRLQVYICMYCDAHFKFKTQLLQHLRRKHNLSVPRRIRIPDSGEIGDSPPDSRDDPLMSMNTSPSRQSDHISGSYMHTGLSETGAEEESLGMESISGNNNAILQRYDAEKDCADASAGDLVTVPSTPTSNLHHSSRAQHIHGKALYDKVNGLYICQFCNKGFDRLFSLHRHERIHTGFKPCYCKYCGRGFSEPRNLRHHMIRFHSDGSELHLIRRVRKRSTSEESFVTAGLSRTSQRLRYIPPGILSHRDVERLDCEVEADDNISMASQSDGEDSVASSAAGEMIQMPSAIHPARNEEEVFTASEETHSPKELANKIREKEQLGEDITVVIPSDAPLEQPKEDNRVTPKSVTSEPTSWPENISEVEMDSSAAGGAIVTAPITSLIGHHQQWRSRRKSSTSAMATMLTPTTATEENHDPACDTDIDIKPVISDLLTPPTPPGCLIAITPDHKPPLSVAAAISLGLPFSPLNISTYMTAGLPGLLPTSLVSPLSQAAFFAQQTLASPTMLSHLPFLNPLATTSLVNATTTASTATKDYPAPATSPTDSSCGGGVDCNQNSNEDMNWLGNDAFGNGRGSSLSRTHSRLYVVRQPVKREDACKPVVLTDGRTVYRCSYCQKDFCTFSDVNRHMDFHEDIRPYKCKFCDYYARTNSQLKVHMMRHQGIREFHCKLCNYKGVTQSDLNRHTKSQIHMMKAQNECKHCGEGFVSPKNLERHYHEKHYSHYEQLAKYALPSQQSSSSSSSLPSGQAEPLDKYSNAEASAALGSSPPGLGYPNATSNCTDPQRE